MSDDITQWICSSEPHCLCTSGGDAMTCDCVVLLEKRECSNCGAAMIEIDSDTGVPVVRRAVS